MGGEAVPENPPEDSEDPIQDVSADLGVSRALSLAATLLDSAPVGLTKAEILSRVDLYREQADASGSAFEQMFSRDKRYLRLNGVEIAEHLPSGSSGRGRGDRQHRYVIDPATYGLPVLDLSDDEAEVLRRVTLLWSDSRAQQSIREVAGALVDAGRAGGGHGVADVLTAPVRSHRTGLGRDRDLELLQTLLERGAGAAVTFDYAPRGARAPARRRVILAGWGLRGHWYLVAHDLDRGEPRTFRLDRIVGEMRPLPEPPQTSGIPEVPLDEAAVEERLDALGSLRDPITTELAVSSDAAETLRAAASSAEASEETEGRVRLRLTTRLDEQFVSTVCRHLEALREPPDPRLRALVLRRLRAVATAQAAAPAAPDPLPRRRPQRRGDSAPDKIARLLNMAAHLEATGGTELSALLARFDVTPRQLHRDLLSLQQAGSFDSDRFGDFIDLDPEIPLSRTEFTEQMLATDPTVSIRLPAGQMRGAMARPLRLTAPGALSLLIGLEGLLASAEHRDSAALRLRRKVREIVPRPLAEAADSLSVAWRTEGDPELRAMLTAAAGSGHAVELRYEDRSDRRSTRVVEPVRLIHDADRSYLQAWCRSSRAERHFRLSRILDAEPRPDDPIGSEAARLADSVPRPPRAPGDGALRAVVWAAPAAVAEVLRWEPAAAAESEGSGLFAELRLPSRRALERLVIEADGDVALLAPPEAVESLTRRIDRGLRRLAEDPESSRMLEDEDERTAP